ncbi:sodium/bile acid cotransporter [Esox lucius]|uniref:Hepatic sodium/bile acid cotransporter n=1 Tax=Esox lucius TaxID=8010 RepID=A0A3P8YVS7_ESOLU|nr:sodium/bile acid cotransporter [Esox lucius]XP_034146066.1 sodium/bile acid cotransporter [Esox lucius]XP_034146067.1 sodium/bile acid cotransporter [Esox lucius]
MEHTTDSNTGLFTERHLFGNDSSLFNISPGHLPSLSPIIEKSINVTSIVILFITMVSLGCTMEVSKIKAHILKPKGVAIAVVAQFGIMPLTAFLLAKVLQLRPLEAVAVLICGCCPGGNLSNLLALALKGDMNLSIVMTTCSTTLALVMMPLLLFLYCQGFSDLGSAVPYVGITVALVMTLVPCGVGVLINYYRPQYSKTITKVGLSILLMATIVIGVLAGVSLGGTSIVKTIFSPPLMATAALMPLIGYTFGYALSYLFRLNGPSRRTIAMETGCQNIQLCSTILKVAFPPDVIGALYLFPGVYIMFQVGEALLLIVLFWVHQRFFHTPKTDKRMYNPVDKQQEEVKEPQEVAV